MQSVRILTGDCLATLPTLAAESVQCCVTSPPYYGLRDYGCEGQIGLEDSPEAYVARLVEVFRQVRRVLREDGTLWLNLGDSYAGSWGAQSRGGPPSPSSTLAGNGHVGGGPKIKGLSAVQIESAPKRTRTGSTAHLDGIKPKDLLGIPWMVAFALRADGWYLRKDIIWAKPNPMPESVRDRPTSAHEYLFLMTKAPRYFYDAEAIKEPVSVPDWDDGSRTFGGVNKHGANIAHGNRTTGRKALRAATESRHRASIPGGQTMQAEPDGKRNARSVWSIPTQPFSASRVPGWSDDHDHYAVMPPALAERCIKAGSRPGDTILDPFGGAGTTALVADRLGRSAILCELNPEYVALAAERLRADAPLIAGVVA
jgi:DNA modification methylase